MARPKNAVKGRAVTAPRKKKAAEPPPVTHTPGPWKIRRQRAGEVEIAGGAS